MSGSRKAAAAAMWILVCLVFVSGPVGAQTAPGAWSTADIGAPVLTGSASIASGAVVVDAAGEGLRETSDQFLFVYQVLTGDGEIRVRIDDLSTVSDWTTAGVMIRAGLGAQAAHASTVWTAGSGAAFQRRHASGLVAVRTEAAHAGRWLRLVRAGSTVTSYVSHDGAVWTAIGSETIGFAGTVYAGLAVASHDPTTRTSAWVTNLSLIPTTAIGLNSSDIGAPSIAGRTAVVNGRYTVTAGGGGIGDAADQFHYAYRPISGDATVTARVVSISNAHKFATAGVMIRETLDPASAHALMAGTSGGGWVFRRRSAPNGTSEQTEAGKSAPPGWVRLVRTGQSIEAFKSTDGRSWSRVGSTVIPMGTTVYVGLAVASRAQNKTTVAVLEGFEVSEAAPAVNRAPVVTLSSDASLTTRVAPASITLLANASDADGSVTAVEFYSGYTLLGTATSAPYQVSVLELQAGTHVFRAVAIDDASNSALSEPLSVLVEAPNRAPSVSLTVAASATVVAPASLALTATVADPDGTVTMVEFFAGSSLIGRQTAAPFTISVSGLGPGSYVFNAVATDDDGAVTSSTPIVLTVAAPAITAPIAVAFTVSSDHATLVVGYTLEIYRAGATPGTVAPLRTLALGKPTPAADGNVQVDCGSWFAALAPGDYVAAVVAVGTGGSARSAAVAFTR